MYTLLHRFSSGRSYQSLQYHRHHLLRDIASWLDVPLNEEPPLIKDELLAVLDTKSRYLPKNEQEWQRLLNQWLRNPSNKIGKDEVKHRTVYRLLAVDGFDGVLGQDLKDYLPNVLSNGLRKEYQRHSRAVRKMYSWLEDDPRVASLTGTDSACVVFLALIRLFTSQIAVLDDQVRVQVERARHNVENYLNRNSNYYKDVQNVDAELLDELSQVYVDVHPDWSPQGLEILNYLSTDSKLNKDDGPYAKKKKLNKEAGSSAQSKGEKN